MMKSKGHKMATPHWELSNRELEILELIATGLTTAKIAKKLFLSAGTIETHRKRIIRKTKVNNITQAVAIAVRTGLIE